MIIVLTGPTGSGKTDTSWELLKVLFDVDDANHIDKTVLDFSDGWVFLDCDWFASMKPFWWDEPTDVAMVYQAMAQMIHFYQQHDKKSFVVTLTSQMAAVFQEHQSILNSMHMPMYAFRLRCDSDTLIDRILIRNRVQLKDELLDGLTQQQFFDETFPNNDIFTLIDVSKLSESEVVNAIYLHIKSVQKG